MSWRYIHSQEWSNVAAVDVTDVFTTDFKTYRIMAQDDDGFGLGYIKFIDSNGSVITDDDYKYSSKTLSPTGTSGNANNTGNNYGIKVIERPTSTTKGSLLNMWVYNPTDPNGVTTCTFESTVNASSTAHRARIGVGLLPMRNVVTGFRIDTVTGGNTTGKLKLYGLAYKDLS